MDDVDPGGVADMAGINKGDFLLEVKYIYNFPNFMEKSVLYLGYFSISFEKIMFYTEILTWQVELWIILLESLVKKDHKTTFLLTV